MPIDTDTAAARIRAVVRPWQEALGTGQGLTEDQVAHGLKRLSEVADELAPPRRAEPPPPAAAGAPVLHLIDCAGPGRRHPQPENGEDRR